MNANDIIINRGKMFMVNMINILYICPQFSTGEVFGGDKTIRLNHEILSELEGYRVIPYFINIKTNKLRKIMSTLRGYKGGMSQIIIDRIMKSLATHYIRIVWLQGSSYGKLSRAIKQKYPNIQIVTFFHNCDYKIYNDFLADKNFLYRRFVLGNVRLNERLTLLYSDVKFFYNTRDLDLCHTVYHITKGKEIIIPMVVNDFYDGIADIGNKTIPQNLLFVGSYFFANIRGLLWFDKNVMPYIDYHLTIIGRGFEDNEFLDQLQNKDKITAKGFVNDLNPEYAEADIVIQPVFDGAGMKTKTAECFMHGKTLVSTSEGLTGYAVEGMNAVYRCDTADAFITILNKLKKELVYKFNHDIRTLFLKKYSKQSRKMAFQQVLDTLKGIITNET